MKNFFLTKRFFYFMGILVLLFCISFLLPIILPFVKLLFVLFLWAFGFDIWQLYGIKRPFVCERITMETMSLGDQNSIYYQIKNQTKRHFYITIIDEIPEQFQDFDFNIHLELDTNEQIKVEYSLKPPTRGNYFFGNIYLFYHSTIGFVERKYTIEAAKEIKVLPSVFHLKEMEWKTFQRNPINLGVKRFRRIGHTLEFEQIKNYVVGDDYRSINWKASSRKASLMINQYEEERSRQVYCIIDQSRVMKTPFEGLTYMEYAINSCLAISNIILKKGDLAGLIKFSKNQPTMIKADRSTKQLNYIIRSLYDAKEDDGDADYEKLYFLIRNKLKQRSLLLLFTNFDSVYGMERALPILRKLQKLHQLVVVFFENSEVTDFANAEANSTVQIYENTVALKYTNEKIQIVQQLEQYGINAIYTNPAQLSLQVINKYLELKSRGI